MRRWSTPGGAWWPDWPADARERDELLRLLTALYVQSGADFRDYHQEGIRRRVWNLVHKEGLDSLPALHQRLQSDPACAGRMLLGLPVHVTAMFRDPPFWRAFREQVVPLLRSQPEVRIWHAGCATGEEAFSMAILLHEEGLLERSQLLATDISESALKSAQEGTSPLARMQDNTTNYLQSGGRASFSEYYAAGSDRVTWRPWLRLRIRFSRHNLASGESLGRFDVVLCRNVLIYFGPRLQERARSLFEASLAPGAVLGLGERESLPESLLSRAYLPLAPERSLFRKRP